MADVRARHPWPTPRRIATLSVHTSPLDQPGTGDAGGMNVYVVEAAGRSEAFSSVTMFSVVARPAD